MRSWRHDLERLEYQLQAKLDSPGSTRAENRIRTDHVGRGWKKSETRAAGTAGIGDTRLKSAGTTFRVRNICMIEHVEEFGAELSRDAFPKPEGLGDREIHVVVRHAAENIVPGGAIASIRKRYQDRLTVGVTTEVGQ